MAPERAVDSSFAIWAHGIAAGSGPSTTTSMASVAALVPGISPASRSRCGGVYHQAVTSGWAAPTVFTP